MTKIQTYKGKIPKLKVNIKNLLKNFNQKKIGESFSKELLDRSFGRDQLTAIAEWLAKNDKVFLLDSTKYRLYRKKQLMRLQEE